MKWPREKSHKGSRMLSVLGIGCLVLLNTGVPQAPPNTQEKTKAGLEQLIYSVKGPELFRAHCAACHGPDAKGGGPMAPALKIKVPDLTVLAKKNGGPFPTARVRKDITGDDVVLSHGSREMPIWGPIFHQIESDQDFGAVRLERLLKYLESVQVK